MKWMVNDDHTNESIDTICVASPRFTAGRESKYVSDACRLVTSQKEEPRTFITAAMHLTLLFTLATCLHSRRPEILFSPQPWVFPQAIEVKNNYTQKRKKERKCRPRRMQRKWQPTARPPLSVTWRRPRPL